MITDGLFKLAPAAVFLASIVLVMPLAAPGAADLAWAEEAEDSAKEAQLFQCVNSAGKTRLQAKLEPSGSDWRCSLAKQGPAAAPSPTAEPSLAGPSNPLQLLADQKFQQGAEAGGVSAEELESLRQNCSGGDAYLCSESRRFILRKLAAGKGGGGAGQAKAP